MSYHGNKQISFFTPHGFVCTLCCTVDADLTLATIRCVTRLLLVALFSGMHQTCISQRGFILWLALTFFVRFIHFLLHSLVLIFSVYFFLPFVRSLSRRHLFSAPLYSFLTSFPSSFHLFLPTLFPFSYIYSTFFLAPVTIKVRFSVLN